MHANHYTTNVKWSLNNKLIIKSKQFNQSINQSSDKHSKTHTKNEKELITSIWIFIFVIPLEKVIVLVVNHGSTRDSIEKFQFSAKDKQLTHLQTYIDPAIHL